MKRFSLFIILGLVAISMAATPIIYVTPNGTGDGSSWKNAMGDIPAAALQAYKNREYTEVWVAGGVYKPDTILAIQDSLSIYGGFAGTETSKDQRVKASNKPWDYLNRTVIDGQNKMRLLKCIQRADTIVEIEGLEFVNGLGTDSDAPVRLTCNAYFHNCIVRDCSNNTSGGGGCQVYPSAHIDGCLFKQNHQSEHANGGGGLYLNTSSEGFTAMIENCEFVGNTSTIRGAGLGVQGGSRTTVRNCRFYDNVAKAADGTLQPGAAIYDNSSLQVVTVNNLMYNNTGITYFYMKGLLAANNTMVKNVGNFYVAAPNDNCQVINNIVWGNWVDEAGTTANGISGTAAAMLCANNATYLSLPEDKGWVKEDNILFSTNVSNGKVSKFEQGVGSGPLFDTVPNFYGAISSELPQAEQEAYRDYLSKFEFNLQTSSPCMNTGREALYVTMSIITKRDSTGARIRDTTYTYEYYANTDYLHLERPQGPQYDMGAVELPYFDAKLQYDANLGSVMDEEANLLANDSVLAFAKGQTMVVYIFSNDSQPFTIEAVYADHTDDVTSLISGEGLFTMPVADNMTLHVKFQGESGLSDVFSNDGNCAIYTIQGMAMPKENLPSGIYILKNGSKAYKIFIR